MIKFICARSNADVGEIMGSVNRYLQIGLSIGEPEGYTEMLFSEMFQSNMDILQIINNSYHINSEPDILSNSKLKRFIKKAIRKMMRWYFNLIMERQSEFNARVVQSLNGQMEAIQALTNQVFFLKEENEKLRLDIRRKYVRKGE